MAVIPQNRARRTLDTGRGSIPNARISDAPGRALQQLGGSITSAGLRAEREAETDGDRTDAFNASVAVLDFQSQANNLIREAQENVVPGAEGFTPGVLSQFDELSQGVLGGITNEKIRQRVDLKLRNFRNKFEETANTVESTEKNRFFGVELDRSQAAFVGNVDRNPAFAESAVEQFKGLLDVAPISEPQKQARLKAFEDLVIERTIKSIGRENPDLAKRVIDKIRKIQKNRLEDQPIATDADKNLPDSLVRSKTRFLPGKGKLPRGVRNNNPGNLEFGKFTRRKGATKSDGRFAKFSTPEAGISAMASLLRSYQKSRGLNTIRKMISRYAPASENNTDAYVNAVAKAMGIKPDQEFDVDASPNLTSRMVAAMILHENGRQPYSAEQISKGVTDGLGVTVEATSAKRNATQKVKGTTVSRETEPLNDPTADLGLNVPAEGVETERALEAVSEIPETELPPELQGVVRVAESQTRINTSGFQGIENDLVKLKLAQLKAAEEKTKEQLKAQKETMRTALSNSIKTAIQQGVTGTVGDEVAEKILSVLGEKEGREAIDTINKFTSPDVLFNPGDSGDKKTLNSAFDSTIGSSALTSKNQEAADDLLQFTEKTQVIPSNAAGAIKALIASNDESQVAFGLQLAEQLFRQNPAMVARDLGKKTVDDLTFFRERAETQPLADIIEQRKELNDPTKQAVRDALRSEGVKLSADIKIDEVLDTFDPGVFGSEPDAPADNTISTRLLLDYRREFIDAYAKTGDEEIAKTMATAQVQRVWGPSLVNRDRLMKYPPEKAVGILVDGSFDWMRADLSDSVRAAVGPIDVNEDPPAIQEQSEQNRLARSRTRDVTVEGQELNNFNQSILGTSIPVPNKGETPEKQLEKVEAALGGKVIVVSTPQTAIDVQNARNPRYMVGVLKDGVFIPLLDRRGQPRPFQFDPTLAQVDARQRFNEQRARALEERRQREQDEIRRREIEAEPGEVTP